MSPIVPFGHQFREKYFNGFDADVTNLNHGAYGATTPELLDIKLKHSKKIQLFPDEFFRYNLFDANLKIRKQVSELVNCAVDDVVLVTNATTAVNTVLRSFPFNQGDVIICFSTIYGACYNTLLFLARSIGIRIVKIDITYPISNKKILDKFLQTIKPFQGPNRPANVMAFMDGITSTPSALFPWQELVKICKQNNLISFVDAAHYIGLLPVDLKATQPDFFTSNFHKWFYVPNSVALLYVHPKYHNRVHSLPISATYIPYNKESVAQEINTANLVSTQAENRTKTNTTLSLQFIYVSTTDYSAMLTIPEAIRFRKEVCGGENAIIQYNLNLAKEAVKFILKNWNGSQLLTGENDDITTAMFNIKLPGFDEECGYDYNSLVTAGTFLNDYLRLEKRTYIPIFIYNGSLWSRWCSQIYLELSDFKWGLEAIKDGIQKYNSKFSKL